MKTGWMGMLLLVFLLAGCQEKEAVIPETTVELQVQTVPAETMETVPVETTEMVLPEPENGDFVRILDYIPTAGQELFYATDRNFTGVRIYEFEDAYLRYGTVKKLMQVSEALEAYGLRLKIWDGFRPTAAQFQLWEICPDPTYVANPEKGFSSHSRGNTVDLTLINENGQELAMPTGFDDFSARADRDYSDCTQLERENALLLQNVMEKYGFQGYYGEWWHYTDVDAYPVEEVFQPVAARWYYADCNEFISLRTKPNTSADVIARIPVREEFRVTAFYGDFALAEYGELCGYVLRSYAAPVAELVKNMAIWKANCEEYISLRERPGGEVITTIPKDGELALLSWEGTSAKVAYNEVTGYVLSSYIIPAEDAYFQNALNTVEPTDSYSYAQLREDLEMLDSSPAAELEWIGTSELGREIPVLRLGSMEAEHHVLLQGAIHGREHMTAWLLVAMADYTLGRGVPENVCWHILPMTNPDGVAISQNGLQNEAQRILYRTDRENGYTKLEKEDYARQWKANGLGVDINRNFPAGWDSINDRESLSAQKYRGEEPFSAAETQVLRDYTLRYDFDATISYHACGSVIYYEYGDKEAVNVRSEELAQTVKAVTGYLLQSSSGVDGAGYKDWAMEELEIPSVTIEVGCGPVPLAEREIYSVFARNMEVLKAVTRWLES